MESANMVDFVLFCCWQERQASSRGKEKKKAPSEEEEAMNSNRFPSSKGTMDENLVKKGRARLKARRFSRLQEVPRAMSSLSPCNSFLMLTYSFRRMHWMVAPRWSSGHCSNCRLATRARVAEAKTGHAKEWPARTRTPIWVSICCTLVHDVSLFCSPPITLGCVQLRGGRKWSSGSTVCSPALTYRSTRWRRNSERGCSTELSCVASSRGLIQTTRGRFRPQHLWRLIVM